MPGPLNLLGIVADGNDGLGFDADGAQAISDISGVGVDGTTLYQFIAGGNDCDAPLALGFHDNSFQMVYSKAGIIAVSAGDPQHQVST